MVSERPRIFDCFTFSTELDLLEFRLDLLAPVVDRFVIVEAPRTFSGIEKPLVFWENRARFKRHLGAISHVIVDDVPAPIPDRWAVERFQRDAILRGLGGIEPDDLVVVTDVDEIPDPAVLETLRRQNFDAVALEMRMCFYRANWEALPRWNQGRVARPAAVGSPEQLRQRGELRCVPEAGAHLSYLMSAADIARKYRYFAHEELDTARDRSQKYLGAMQALAVLAMTGELLAVTGRSTLSPVQRALLERAPELFNFEVPPRLLRSAAMGWRRARSRSLAPESLVMFGDSILGGIAQRVAGRSARANGQSDTRQTTMGVRSNPCR